MDVADGDGDRILRDETKVVVDPLERETERFFHQLVDAEGGESRADGEMGRGRSRDHGEVVGALGQGGVEVGEGEGLGDAVAFRDLGAAGGVGFAEGDRVAAVELLEDTQVALADGAGADDEESHEGGGSTRQGLVKDPTPSGPFWQRGKGDKSGRDGGALAVRVSEETTAVMERDLRHGRRPIVGG